LAITLSGGGNRAFYELGLLHRWWSQLEPRVAGLATCSAGACVAAMFFSGREEHVSAFWRKQVQGITRNFEMRRLLRGKRPAPHAAVYRATLLETARQGGLERIRQQPFPLWVLTAGVPKWMPPAAAAPIGLGAYNLEKRLAPRRLHPTFGRRIGFHPAVFDLRDCQTPEELADLVIASSSTPPFTPLGRYRGHWLLDGGMVDNVPADVADSLDGVKYNLVLLTRPYPSGVTGRHGHRLYVAPSRPVPVARWDYTQPHLVGQTVQMGEEEADLHASELQSLLGAEESADRPTP
jgi:predicted acylesterase/phospholipase RssA